MKYISFGDSITAHAGASPASNSYINLLNVDFGQAFENTGVSTAMAIDCTSALFSKNTASGDKSVIMFGTNDQAKYDVDVTKRGYFIDAIRGYAVWLCANSVLATPANGVTFTGTWSNGYALGTYGSSAANSKATFTVSGSNICLGVFRQYNNTSTFNIKIDGVDKGNFSSGGDVRTLLGASYGINGLMFTGLSAGTHSVELTVLSANASNVVFFKFYSGLLPKAKASIVNIPHAVNYTYGGSNANVDNYNIAIAALVAELAGYGLDVSIADVSSQLTPSHMADNVHPNNAGHLKIRGVIYTSLTGNAPPPLFTETKIYLGTDGNLYGGNIGSLVQLN